jgi:predicted membrane metal-binding protein
VTEIRRALARHPLHLALASIVGGLLLAMAGPVATVLGAALAAALAMVAGRPRFGVLAAALVLTAAWAGERRLAAIDHSPLGPHIGRIVTVRGHLLARKRSAGRGYRAWLEVTAAGLGTARDRPEERLRAAAERVELVASRPPRAALAVGDELLVEGSLERPGRRSGGEFDYPAYLRRAGIHAVLRAERVVVTGRTRVGVEGAIDAIRRRAESGVSARLDRRLGALARGVVLGQDEQIDQRSVERFQASGLAHLLSVRQQDRIRWRATCF